MDGIVEIRAHDTSNYERAEISSRLGRIFRIRFEFYQRKFLIKFDPPGASEFELVLLRTTWLGAALDRFAPDFFASGARAQVLANYASAEAIAAEEHSRPRFARRRAQK